MDYAEIIADVLYHMVQEEQASDKDVFAKVAKDLGNLGNPETPGNDEGIKESLIQIAQKLELVG